MDVTTGPCPHKRGPTASIRLNEPGIWLLTTKAGTLVLVAIVLDPATGVPFVTVTRFAAAGKGEHLNCEPMTVIATAPPAVGERWAMNVIQLRHRDAGGNVQLPERNHSSYVTTAVTQIRVLTYDLLHKLTATCPAASEPGTHG